MTLLWYNNYYRELRNNSQKTKTRSVIMSELDFEMNGILTEDYDYYNDHRAMSLEDINYDNMESDFGREQLSQEELESIL
jgi:hypothetical protein